MIDRFTKQEFEDALPSGWKYAGFDGEHIYYIPVTQRVGVMVRSSVQLDNRAAPSGGDSIRIYLTNASHNKPLAKKLDAWTQRTAGWQTRMRDKITQLTRQGVKMVNCPECDTGVLREREGKYGTFYGCSNYPRCRYTTNSLDRVRSQPAPDPEPEDDTDSDVDFGAIFESLDDDDDDFDFSEPDLIVVPDNDTDIELNDQQRAFVEAPCNADIRVLAGPGAGKTFSVIRRIQYLIESCRIDPNAIVYVTFTKAMADEGYDRILRRLPTVATTRLSKQICTIHALCYRMLRWEGLKRDVPKEWEVKKAINEIIVGDNRQNIRGEWQYAYEKPGYKEVLYWIDKAKFHGLTGTEDFRYFLQHMIHDHASKVHSARKRFDEWLESNNYITFSDMIYMVEQKLIHDRSFREKYQKKFTHVLVDEAQDVNAQALRILITLSLEPGDNRVYNRWLTERE